MIQDSNESYVEEVPSVYSSSDEAFHTETFERELNLVSSTTESRIVIHYLRKERADQSLIRPKETMSNSSEEFVEEILGRPIKIENFEERKCLVCFKKFRYLSKLEQHMRLHTGKKPFECPICFQSFAHKQSMTDHVLKHAGVTIDCELCPKKFAPRSYRSHLRSFHHLKEVYKCKKCNLAFLTPFLLQKHKCRFSEEATATVCEICDKKFAKNKNLRRHKILHAELKPFKCEICHKRFARKDSIILHNRVHTKEKPYKCLKCQQRFSQNCSLREHMRRHDGVPGYNCSFCGVKYARKSHWERHEAHHKRTNNLDAFIQKEKLRSKMARSSEVKGDRKTKVKMEGAVTRKRAKQIKEENLQYEIAKSSEVIGNQKSQVKMEKTVRRKRKQTVKSNLQSETTRSARVQKRNLAKQNAMACTARRKRTKRTKDHPVQRLTEQPIVLSVEKYTPQIIELNPSDIFMEESVDDPPVMFPLTPSEGAEANAVGFYTSPSKAEWSLKDDDAKSPRNGEFQIFRDLLRMECCFMQ